MDVTVKIVKEIIEDELQHEGYEPNTRAVLKKLLKRIDNEVIDNDLNYLIKKLKEDEVKTAQRLNDFNSFNSKNTFK